MFTGLDSCQVQKLPSQLLLLRFDYILGIHKFSGSSSYPYNEGIFLGILGDLFLLFCLLLHKMYLV